MSYPETPLHAAGRLATNWESIESILEEALLELIGCPNYRGKALTTHLAFTQMWRAFRVLLIDSRGSTFVKTARFRQLHTDLFAVRKERNTIIHADWHSISTQEDITITAVDMDVRNSLEGKEVGYSGSDIGQIADLAISVHLDLVNFLTTECGIPPFADKYVLPHHQA